MEKRVNVIKKSTLIVINNGVEVNDTLKKKISNLHDKVQQKLLWSNIIAIFSYLALFVTMARMYSIFHGKQRFLMLGSMGAVYIFMAILLFIAWKNTAYKWPELKKASETFLHQQVELAAGNCRAVSLYLAIYAVFTAIGGFFFMMDIYNGFTLILKLAVPVSTAAYFLGLQFIVQFKHQQQKLALLKQEVAHERFLKNVSGN